MYCNVAVGWKVVVTLAHNLTLQLLAFAHRLLSIFHERKCLQPKAKCRKYLIA